MTALSLIFLVVCIFGAVAYGSATAMALGQASPVWSEYRGKASRRSPMDRVSLAMFFTSTVWFILNTLSEFRRLGGGAAREGLVDLAILAIAFLYPPLIMHVVLRETHCGEMNRARAWRWLVGAMYALSPAFGALIIAAIFDVIPRPRQLGAIIGASLGAVFTVSSVYSMALMIRARRARHTPERRMENAMLLLFGVVLVIFTVVSWLDDRSLLVVFADRLSRTTPLFFLVVAVYFENRFEFYDLIVKRGAMLIVTAVALGLAFTAVEGFIEGLPAGAGRPWVAGMVLLPVVMVMPWIYGRLSRGLDRLWFGRSFTAVDAVKHMLGAMQEATNEAALVSDSERRLHAIFGTPIIIRLDDRAEADTTALEVDGATPSGERVRFVAATSPGTRHLLSEDVAMLRSLASVFGFMLETMRLQHKRQEQELVARELRLQTSRSELKALRAQINPHFLFNALNAIASLIHTNPDRADEAVEQLAEVFRYTLRRSDADWAPLDQELSFARAYLDVEQARFGRRLTCVIDSDHLAPAPQIPSMLLQTLIENAVKHGVSQTRGPGRIDVIVRTTSETVLVEVRDNGPGPGQADPRRRQGEGFGLRSVRERLEGHFGNRASLTLTRDERAGITVARIIMPLARIAA
jgi:signal transduction histidine kinase